MITRFFILRSNCHIIRIGAHDVFATHGSVRLALDVCLLLRICVLIPVRVYVGLQACHTIPIIIYWLIEDIRKNALINSFVLFVLLINRVSIVWFRLMIQCGVAMPRLCRANKSRNHSSIFVVVCCFFVLLTFQQHTHAHSASARYPLRRSISIIRHCLCCRYTVFFVFLFRSFVCSCCVLVLPFFALCIESVYCSVVESHDFQRRHREKEWVSEKMSERLSERTNERVPCICDRSCASICIGRQSRETIIRVSVWTPKSRHEKKEEMKQQKKKRHTKKLKCIALRVECREPVLWLCVECMYRNA